MTKIYNLPDNAGYVINNDDTNTNGFQYTLTGGKVLITTTDVSTLEEGFFGGDIAGLVQNAIISEMSEPKKATLAELNILLTIVG